MQRCKNNPHKNHKVIKLELEEKILSDNEILFIIRNSFYFYYVKKILDILLNDDQLFMCNNKKQNKIFTNKEQNIINYINILNIKKIILDELKNIENIMNESTDNIIRKYLTDCYGLYYSYMLPEYLIFNSDQSVNTFYFDAKKLIKNNIKKK